MIKHLNANLIFLGIALNTVIINADTTVVNLALSSIGNMFHSPLSTLQWLISIYLLLGIPMLIFSGKLADIFGEKNIYIFGTIVFMLGSLISGLAHTITVLIIGRAIQGFAYGFILSLGLILLTANHPKNKWGNILGYYTMIAGFSQALGPSLGGFILQYLGWRWLFLLNVPFGIISTILLLIFCNTQEKIVQEKSIDIGGALLLIIGLILLILSSDTIIYYGISSFIFWKYFLGSLILLFIFWLFERYKQQPLIDFSLYKNHNYLYVTIIRAINMYAWFAIIFGLPIYCQNILNMSPVKAGFVILMLAFMYGAASPFMGKLLDRCGYKKMLILASALNVISCVIFATLSLNPNWGILFIGSLLFGLNKAIILPCSVGIVMYNLPKNKTGVGLGVFYSLSFIGGILGITITTFAINFFSFQRLNFYLRDFFILFNQNQLRILKNMTSGALNTIPVHLNLSSDHLAEIITFAKSSFIYGFNYAIWFTTFLSFVALILSFFINFSSEISKEEAISKM